MVRASVVLLLIGFVTLIHTASSWAGTGDVLLAIENPFPGPDDLFGVPACVNGTIWIGCTGNDTFGTDSGIGYGFDVSARGVYAGPPLATIPAADPVIQAGDRFGYKLVPFGDNLLVGAEWYAGGVGRAWMFDGSSGDLLATFFNPDPQSGDHFGSSLAVWGDNVLVGAQLDDTYGTNAGNLYLLDGSTGDPLPLPFPMPSIASGDRIGSAIDAGNGLLAVGASLGNAGVRDAGRVHLWNDTLGQWIDVPNPHPQRSAYFGQSVAVVGDKILAGAPQHDEAGNADAGAAYLFDDRGNLLREFYGEGAGDLFGKVLAAVGDDFVIGAEGYQGYTGRVYYVEGLTYGVTPIDNPSLDPAGDRFGEIIAPCGPNFLVRAGFDDPAGVPNAGTVYLLQGPQTTTAVPEPSTSALAAVALAGLLAYRRRGRPSRAGETAR